jgi:hypothetical protein
MDRQPDNQSHGKSLIQSYCKSEHQPDRPAHRRSNDDAGHRPEPIRQSISWPERQSHGKSHGKSHGQSHRTGANHGERGSIPERESDRDPDPDPDLDLSPSFDHTRGARNTTTHTVALDVDIDVAERITQHHANDRVHHAAKFYAHCYHDAHQLCAPLWATRAGHNERVEDRDCVREELASAETLATKPGVGWGCAAGCCGWVCAPSAPILIPQAVNQ